MGSIWGTEAPMSEEQKEIVRERLRKEYPFSPFLLPDCHPSLREVPNLAYFGIAVTRKELLDYAKKQGHYADACKLYSTESVRILSALEAAQRTLSDKAKYRLRLRNPISGDYPWILALYSNFGFRVEELPEEQERAVLMTIVKELKPKGDRRAFWWYDIREGSVGMRCDPWIPLTGEELAKFREAYREEGIEMTDATVNRMIED
ncbi:hypothetical protein BC629DRAFT_1498914 [Irpex lacteus]|nr:hypothetical protein BC629DRAFT_1498914 [Irpex lacteus]